MMLHDEHDGMCACVIGASGSSKGEFGNPAADGGIDGKGEGARGGTGLVRVVRQTSIRC